MHRINKGVWLIGVCIAIFLAGFLVGSRSSEETRAPNSQTSRTTTASKPWQEQNFDDRQKQERVEQNGAVEINGNMDEDEPISDIEKLADRYRSLPDYKDDDDVINARFELLMSIAKLPEDPRASERAILDLVSEHDQHSYARDDAAPAAGEALAYLWAQNPEMILEGRGLLNTETNPRALEALVLACMRHKGSSELAGLADDLMWLGGAHDDQSLQGLIALNIGWVWLLSDDDGVPQSGGV